MDQTTNVMLLRLFEIEPNLQTESERLWLKSGQVINHGSGSDFVYFPEGCTVARTVKNARGKWTDVWLTGREGFSEVASLLVDVKHPFRTQVRAPGYARRVAREAIATTLQQSSARSLVQRYADFILVQAAHIGHCNGAHSLDDRILRHLLFTHWASGSRDLRLTHALLADSLGAHRPSVTLRLRELHDAGGIALERTMISIRDRARLEHAACPCCRTILAHYDRLFARFTQARDLWMV